MRKSTKIAVVLAAAALLVAGFAFTTLAKGWVKEGEGLYYYEDAYGMKEYMKWEKDGANYYYLGEDGYMVTNKLVEDGVNTYWCGADGAKVTNQWVQVPADELDQDELGVDYRWYYFDKNGQAYKGKTKDIDGKKYFFNADGKMLYGYVDGTAFTMTTKVSEAYVAGGNYLYFCGTNEEGWARKSEWIKETVDATEDAYDNSSTFWAWYQSNGKKAVENGGKGYLVSGVRYYFSEAGKMLTGWQVLSNSTTASYLGGADNGLIAKKGWVYAVPMDKDNDSDAKADTKKWFYFKNDGKAIDEAGVYKINGKFYAFAAVENANKASKMLSGLVTLTLPSANAALTEATVGVKVKTSDKTLAAWLAGNYSNLYFFSNDEANDGALHKGTSFTAEFEEDSYTLNVDKYGKLTNGYVNKRYYKNGYLLKASEDLRYEVVNVYGFNSKNYALLTVAGTEVTKGYVADADGNYYVVKGAKIFKADSSLLAPAQTAAAWNNKKDTETTATFKYDNVTYTVSEGATVDGVTELNVQ